MTRDELLIHGFKRVMEALTVILEANNKQIDLLKELISLSKEQAYKAGIIQDHVSSIDEKVLQITGSIERLEDELKKIQSNTFLTATKRGNDE